MTKRKEEPTIHRTKIKNLGRRESRSQPVYLVVGKNLQGQLMYPNPYICQECKQTLSFKLLAKKINLHEKCMWAVKHRQVKQRLLAEAAKALQATAPENVSVSIVE